MPDYRTDLRVTPGDEAELRATLATADDGTTLCTIYPARVADDKQTTTWISAEEGSFVSLTDVR